jgi:hypothetical protein
MRSRAVDSRYDSWLWSIHKGTASTVELSLLSLSLQQRQRGGVGLTLNYFCLLQIHDCIGDAYKVTGGSGVTTRNMKSKREPGG